MTKLGTGGVADVDEYLSTRLDLHHHIAMRNVAKQRDRIFGALDAGDVETFLEFLEDDAVFTFGSQAPVRGKPDIRAYVSGFLSTIEGMTHRIDESFCAGELMVIRGTTVYHKCDGSQCAVPFCDIWVVTLKERIKSYTIYCDPTELSS